MPEQHPHHKSMFEQKMDENRKDFDAQRQADPTNPDLAVHRFMRRDESERQGLHDLCQWLTKRGCNMGTCIEIGSFVGESALVFAQYFDSVICIDPFEFVGPGFDENMDNLQKAGLTRDIVREGFFENTSAVDNITLIEKPDSEVSMTGDFVYIDSEHTFVECLATINRWRDRVTWVGGHDYVCADVQLAVDATGPSVQFPDHSWVLDH